jgi:hypothetical protein
LKIEEAKLKTEPGTVYLRYAAFSITTMKRRRLK